MSKLRWTWSKGTINRDGEWVFDLDDYWQLHGDEGVEEMVEFLLDALNAAEEARAMAEILPAVIEDARASAHMAAVIERIEQQREAVFRAEREAKREQQRAELLAIRDKMAEVR